MLRFAQYRMATKAVRSYQEPRVTKRASDMQILHDLGPERMADAEQMGVTARYIEAAVDESSAKLSGKRSRTDIEIARATLDALGLNPAVPKNRLTVTVDGGWVRPQGTVDSYDQKEAAAAAVFVLRGVIGLFNEIRVKDKFRGGDLKGRIFRAFGEHAEHEARRVGVDVHNRCRVVLHGSLHDRSEVRAALGTAWSAPGVTNVENRLSVEW